VDDQKVALLTFLQGGDFSCAPFGEIYAARDMDFRFCEHTNTFYHVFSCTMLHDFLLMLIMRP
jgi:hypothetical protein